MTDAEATANGWRWALRGSDGALLALTTCPEDVGEWDRRYGHDHHIIALRNLMPKDALPAPPAEQPTPGHMASVERPRKPGYAASLNVCGQVPQRPPPF